ncbi:hypothetical protein MF271_23390 (plasmid) [Deinococcus sp. KNUC1210]|uniref:hypothetical protein n=1 Tax=Deinococcus sp. KNUC1210 TaxID=2917691 RepID=UPI001EF02C6F|nr:hypothetical protein [Deinococcus sp. KNUC1210]ULH17918.1 hypothetical protein MF271_23390 [Deinococcus sp. KNUC1210]
MGGDGVTGEETLGTAPYCLDDDTLRWTPGERLDAPTSARTRELGFKFWGASVCSW